MINIKLIGEDYGILANHLQTTWFELPNTDVQMLVQAQVLEVVERFHAKSFWPTKTASMSLKPALALGLKIWLANTQRPDNPYTLSLTISLTDIICKQLNLKLKTWMPF